MTWSDGFVPVFKGTRSFTLKQCGADLTEFVMEERFEGLVFAIVKNRLPDFKTIFERYALDLKNEAERLYDSISVATV